MSDAKTNNDRDQLKRSSASVIFATVGWQVICGLAICIGFYALIHMQILTHPLVVRYFAGHPVEYVTTALFFIGMVALSLNGLDAVGQFGTLNEVGLGPRDDQPQSTGDLPRLLHALRELPGYIQASLLAQRFTNILHYVQRKGTVQGLDAELKHLSDVDAQRQQDSYALVRIIIWATPMLGFLGTVIGITLALGDLSPQALVNTPEKAMQGLLAGLSVAFDTTALAISLSIVLMFFKFLTNQLETELMSSVDKIVTAELVGRFEEEATDQDPHLAQLRRMTQAVVQASEQLVARQADVWKQTIDDAHQQWQTIATHTSHSVRETVDQHLQSHLKTLNEHDQVSSQQTLQHWQTLAAALTHNARVMQQQQKELAKQGDRLLHAIQHQSDHRETVIENVELKGKAA